MLIKNYNEEYTAMFGLCENRHDYPVKECLFPESIPVFGFGGQECDAEAVLKPLVEDGLTRLVIYASGCVPALISAINVAQRLKIREVIIMHYDGLRGSYQPQKVYTLNDIYK